MRGEGADGRELPVIRRRSGGSTLNGLALLVIAAPFLAGWAWRAGVDDGTVEDAARASRTIVGADVLETRASEGFAEVAGDVAKAASPPSWESLRGLLKARRQVDMWYSVRVGWKMDDGSREETTFVRHPYHDRDHFREFLRMVRDDQQTGRFATSVAMQRPPAAEDQIPIPDGIVQRLRQDRPWAR